MILWKCGERRQKPFRNRCVCLAAGRHFEAEALLDWTTADRSGHQALRDAHSLRSGLCGPFQGRNAYVQTLFILLYADILKRDAGFTHARLYTQRHQKKGNFAGFERTSILFIDGISWGG